ncbi:4Fe-4S cluster-binding domain-containing protein, partial [Salmonella enterica]|uniref:4Fe-4S cluster-binding domain-containing protein n=1 Tax=Salmonella enterica TaxID=28901 RepID=UPI00398C5C6E
KGTWRCNYGRTVTKEVEDQLMADRKDTRIHRQGISRSCGDPRDPQNVPDILALVQRINAECPGKDIWVWTGYTPDELNAAQMQVCDSIHVLRDGTMVTDLKQQALLRPGTRNMEVHHCRVVQQAFAS